MAPGLTPELALAYLWELSVDVRAGVVLGPGDRCLAGEPALALAAGELVAGLDGAHEGVGVSRGGRVFVSRADGLAIVLVCGTQAIGGLVLHDLRLVLGDLGAAAPASAGPPVELAPEAVGRAISAAQRGPGA